MSNYLHPDVISRAQALGLQARSIVEGLRVGDHKSPFRGFSVEFVQHREYVPGDDTRHIDWKSYGRSERYTIKQYEQETNFIGHILLDGSKSMAYGQGSTNKLEYAKLLAATLTYMIVHQRDSVGLHIFDSQWRDRVPSSSQPSQVQTILRALQTLQPEEKTSIGPLLEDLGQQITRRGLVFLISDCFDDPESLLKGIRLLRFQGHEVMLFHIMHADEIDFPFDGMVKFAGLEVQQSLLTRPKLIRPAYINALDDYLKKLQRGCEANRCDYLLLNTAEPLAHALSQYLAKRQKVRMR